ncbi:MAG: hypothetical protein L0H59_08345 [Tomitella sp.]|nr:hypothetical protein [Tomitella sp.]
MTAPLSGASLRRIRVLIIRQRLERAALDLLCAAEARGSADRLHAVVPSRLLLLAADAYDQEFEDLVWIARRAGAVYRETSKVLHSNRAFGDVPEVLVKEWEAVVANVRDAVAKKLEPMSIERIAP